MKAIRSLRGYPAEDREPTAMTQSAGARSNHSIRCPETRPRSARSFPGGVLSERIGRRPVFIAGGIIAALASIGSGLVNDFGHLVILRSSPAREARSR